MHPAAWLVWATCAGLVTFTTTDPFYLALIVAVSWFVYAAQRIPGETSRSFRVFAIAGLLTMAGAHDVGVLRDGRCEQRGVRRPRRCPARDLLVVFGTFNAVTDPFGVVRLAPRRFHEPALAAALALSIAPRTVAMVGRVREAQRLRGLRRDAMAHAPRRSPLPVLETGMEEAVTLAGVDGRTGPRPRSTLPLPAGTLVRGRRRHDRVRRCWRRRCSWWRRSPGEAGCIPRRSRSPGPTPTPVLVAHDRACSRFPGSCRTRRPPTEDPR